MQDCLISTSYALLQDREKRGCLLIAFLFFASSSAYSYRTGRQSVTLTSTGRGVPLVPV